MFSCFQRAIIRNLRSDEKIVLGSALRITCIRNSLLRLTCKIEGLGRLILYYHYWCIYDVQISDLFLKVIPPAYTHTICVIRLSNQLIHKHVLAIDNIR
jgi:hypothetical protein